MDASAWTLLLWVVLLVGILGLEVRQYHRDKRTIEWAELRAPLAPNAVRLDEALRAAEEGFNECAACGFENLKHLIFCSMCGAPIVRAPANDSDDKESPSSIQVTVLTTDRGAVAGDERRLRRIRARKDWTRCVEEDGPASWCRGDTATTSSSTAHPALVLQYGDGPIALPPPELQIVVVNDGNGTDENRARELVLEPEGGADSDSPEQDVSADGDGRPVRSKVPLVAIEAVSELLTMQVGAAPMKLVEAIGADPFRSAVIITEITDEDKSSRKQLAEDIQLAFPNKLAQFITRSTAITAVNTSAVKVYIHREHLVQDSIMALARLSRHDICDPFRIDFVEDSGVDAGGLYREWFLLLNEQLVHSETGIFTCLDHIDQTFYLNHHSRRDIGEHHLAHFFAVGRLIGRALLEGYVTGFHLSLPLLKIILGQPVSFADLEYLDPETYKNLQWLLDNDGVDALGLDFSVTETVSSDSTGLEDPSCDAQETESDKNSSTTKVEVVDLIPNGRHIDVTDDNKHEYVDRRFRYMVFERVSSQLFAFLKGVYEVMPPELLMLFDAEELDYVLSGSDEIDVDDWERNAKYTSDLIEHPVREWFWSIVREMPNEYRRRLLQFSTGSSRVPVSGFATLTSYDGRLCPFTLKGMNWDLEPNIRSHACFNRVDLPRYRTKKELHFVLFAILSGGRSGFTMV